MYNAAVIVYCSIKISLFCYFSATLEPKHDTAIPLNDCDVEQRNPKPLVPFKHSQRLLFQRCDKSADFLAFLYPLFFFLFECGVMFKSGIIAFFDALGFQCVSFLRLGDGRILFYMRLHELGHDRHFILFLLHFGIKRRSFAERLPDKLTVSKHCGAIAHQVIVGDEEALFDFVLGECRSLASVLIFEFLIALKYHASIFIRGMPDLSAVETSTVSADDFTVKSLITVCSTQFLAPYHFFLHRIKLLRGYNGFMRTFHIILGYFAVIYPQFFC